MSDSLELERVKFSAKCNKLSGRKINELSECWFWTSNIRPDGYGSYQSNFAKQKGILYSHQASYYLFKDQTYSPSVEQHCSHLCESATDRPAHRRCINPEHLVVESRVTNLSRRDLSYIKKDSDHNSCKLTLEQAKEVQEKHIAGREYTDIAKDYNVNKKTIERICIGNTYGLPDTRIVLAEKKVERDNRIKKLIENGKTYSEIKAIENVSLAYISGVKNSH